jgi:hypothetical protein
VSADTILKTSLTEIFKAKMGHPDHGHNVYILNRFCNTQSYKCSMRKHVNVI